VRIQPTTFHELYSRYAEDVYRFAHWLTGNPADAEDITSETFVRVWTAPEEPRMETVKGYLLTIARNLHRQRQRRSWRESPLEQQTVERAAPDASPAEAAEKREAFHETLQAMQQLPELDRTALLLRAEGELSYEEIAATTGMTAAAARVRVFRARAKLAELLQGEKDEHHQKHY